MINFLLLTKIQLINFNIINIFQYRKYILYFYLQRNRNKRATADDARIYAYDECYKDFYYAMLLFYRSKTTKTNFD